MNSRDNNLLQKIKDNAFYVALGVGLLAVLAVVGVYTARRDGDQLASNDVDLNRASDYSAITTEEQRVEETNGRTANQTGTEKRTTVTTTEKITTEEKTEEKTTEADTEEQATTEAVTEEQQQIPVTADAGELNFTSEKTIS